MYAGISGRTARQGYTGDSVRQKFTRKERDNETGLDYFGARYYASTQSRFTGADPVLIDLKKLMDPQRINAYAYARNNPLRFIDPDGADPIDPPKTPKVEIKHEHYPAHGGTPQDAWKDAGATGPYSPYTGKTDLTFKWEGKIFASAPRPKRHGYVSTATGANLQLVATITITTPQWQSSSPDPAKASAENQVFQNATSSLEKHEDGHAQIAIAGANELQERANGVSVTASGRTPQEAQNKALDGAKSQIEAIGNDVNQRMNTAQVNYDQVTDHGNHQENAPKQFELPKRQPHE